MKTFFAAIQNFVYLAGRRSFYRYCLALACGVLLGLGFLVPQLFIVSWFAFVPLLFALQNVSYRQAYGLGLTAGMATMALSTYWIGDFIDNLKAYSPFLRLSLSLAFWFYSAHLIVFIAMMYRLLSVHDEAAVLIIFPTLVCLSFALYPAMFAVQLGASQSHFQLALQGLEFTGVYGLDFIIGLANALSFLLLKRSPRPAWGACASLLVIGLWFIYGAFALKYWDKKVETAPQMKLAMVQVNESPSAQKSMPAPGYSHAYPLEMALSEILEDKDLTAIIWPETRHRGYFSLPHVAEAFRFYAQTFSTPLIFQDNESINRDGKVLRYNSAVFINAEGEEAGKYRKVERIPFGESLPLFNENAAAKRMLREYVGDFFADLAPGEDRVAFRVDIKSTMQKNQDEKGKQQKDKQKKQQDRKQKIESDYSLAIPLICYELIFPRFVAAGVPKSKAPVFLLGQSNNAWFGATAQPYQHMRAAQLRAIENRLPLVHSTNNGPSALVSPSGRILAQTPYAEVGAYEFALPLIAAEGKTFFGRYPNAFLAFVVIIFIALILRALRLRFFAKAPSGGYGKR